jgi:hypothetical protein
MTSRCSICRHPQRNRIEQLLAEGHSNRSVARLFSVGEASIRRHRAHPVLPPATRDLARQLVTLNALALEAAHSMNQQLRVLTQANQLLLAQAKGVGHELV